MPGLDYSHSRFDRFSFCKQVPAVAGLEDLQRFVNYVHAAGGLLAILGLCFFSISSWALPNSPYATKVYLGDDVEISLYTPTMFRFRVSQVGGDKFPARYEIPFVIGKTDSWPSVKYQRWTERGIDFIGTSQIQIQIPQHTHSWTVWSSGGKSQIYPSQGPTYGMFRDGYTVFDSASAFGERNDNSRFAHWFYNRTTGRYVDTYLADDLILDEYFIYGPSYEELFRQMNELIGPEPLLPKKAYGFFQTQHLGCSGNQQKLLELAQKLREHRIPSDNLIVDYEWGDSCAQEGQENERYWGGLDWSPGYSAPWSPPDFMAKLHALHFDVMLIHHSVPDFPHRAEDTPRRTRDWTSKVYDEQLWWNALCAQLDAGVDGAWQDTRQNDVTDSVIWQGLQTCDGSARRVLFMGVRNMMWIDPFSFDRDDTIPTNSMIGSRRYPFRWTGDTGMTWAEFRYQISAITGNYGAMDGVTYITADGFANLWQERARWNQFLDFLPVARSHTVKPWDARLDAPFLAELMDRREHQPLSSQGAKLEPEGPSQQPNSLTAESSVRKHLQLRYRLLPYLYSYAHINYSTGMPIVRPMSLAFPDDPYCKFNRWPYQFMFGSSLLIAPVYGDFETMEINLPQGSEWIDYWSKKSYPGGSVVEYDTHDPETLPIFVRAGSIIPMRQDADWIDPGVPDDPLTLDVYPSTRPSTFLLYEDDGVSTLYQTGQFSTTVFAVQREPMGNITISLGPSQGEYLGKPRSRTYIVDVNLIGEAPRAVIRGGQPMPQRESLVRLANESQGWVFDSQGQKVRVKFSQTAAGSSTVVISTARSR